MGEVDGRRRGEKGIDGKRGGWERGGEMIGRDGREKVHEDWIGATGTEKVE